MENTVLKEYQWRFQHICLHMESYLDVFKNLRKENLISKITSEVEGPQQQLQMKMLKS